MKELYYKIKEILAKTIEDQKGAPEPLPDLKKQDNDKQMEMELFQISEEEDALI
jgi:hypothetical protein